jgi:RHS repeat-associated protein
MTDATGSTSWTYNINGQTLTRHQTTGTVALTMTYNPSSGSSLLNSVYYPSGRTVSYSYDTDKRISAITSSSTLAGSVAYLPFGPATGWTQVDSVAYGRPIDQDGRVSAVTIGGTTNVQTLSYDLASRLTGLTETGLSAKAYGYDNDNRLTSLTIGTASPTTYTYDVNGNRTSVTDPSSNVTTYNYPGTSNKLSSLSGYVSETLSYDAAGNETGDGTNTWAYNARGRMATVTVGSTTTTYGVNGLGQRVTKSGAGVSGGGTNEYMYDEQGHLLGEYNSTGQRIEETVYLYDAPVAIMIGTGSTPTFYALAPDWQNTPHIVANTSGTNAWTWDRLGFGDNAPNTNPGGLGTFVYNPRFPGQLADVESGTNDNGFRTYNPNFGRYIQSDPIGLWGGMSTYGYVSSSPLRYVDRFGLQLSPWDIFNPDGTVSDYGMTNSRQFMSSSELGNRALGNQYSKWTTTTYCEPSNPSFAYETHFYVNDATGLPYYDLDYKTLPSGPNSEPNPLRPNTIVSPESPPAIEPMTGGGGGGGGGNILDPFDPLHTHPFSQQENY